MADSISYLKQLNLMRDNYQKNGNALINTEDDSTQVGNNVSTFAYMNTVQPNTTSQSASEWLVQSQNQQKREDTRSGWAKFWDGVQDVFDTVQEGILNVVDQVGDFLIGTAGTIGTWFGADDEWAKTAMNYDWQGVVQGYQEKIDPFHKALSFIKGDMFTADYWTNNDIFNPEAVRQNYRAKQDNTWLDQAGNGAVSNVLETIGEILPSVGLGIVTGGASVGAQVGAQAALGGISAGGRAYQNVVKEGKDLNWRTTLYAYAQGGVGAGSHALFSWLGGNIGQTTGLFNNIRNKVFEKTGSKLLATASRIATRAGVRGLETTALSLAEPALKSIYDDGQALEQAYGNGNAWNTINSSLEAGVKSAVASATIETIFEGGKRIALGKEGYNQNFIDEYNLSKNPKLRSNSIKLKQQIKENEKLLNELKKGGLSESKQASIVNRLDKLRGEMEQTQNALNDTLKTFNETGVPEFKNKASFEKYFKASAEKINQTTIKLANSAKESAFKNYSVSTVKKLYDEGIRQGFTPEQMREKFKETNLDELFKNAQNYKVEDSDMNIYPTSKSNVLLLENKNGDTIKLVDNKVKVNNVKDLNAVSTFLNGIDKKDNIISNITIGNNLLPFSSFAVKDTDKPLTISSDVVKGLKTGSLEFNKKGELLQAGNGNYKFVSKLEDGKYQITTIDDKTNEIIKIENSDKPLSQISYQIVPRSEDETKYQTTKALNKEGKPITVSQNNMGFIDNEDFNLYADEKGEMFIYSKHPLYSNNFEKELTAPKVNEKLGINISKEHLLQEINGNKGNPINVIKHLSRLSGLNPSRVIKRLGYDAFSDDTNNEWHISDPRQIIKKGVNYSYEKSISEHRGRYDGVNTRKQIQGKSVKEIRKDLIRKNYGRNAQRLVEKEYKEGNFEVAKLTDSDVKSNKLLSSVVERYKDLGANKVSFLLSNGSKVPCKGSTDTEGNIDIYLDLANEGTLRHEELELIKIKHNEVYQNFEYKIESLITNNEYYSKIFKKYADKFEKYYPSADPKDLRKEFICDVYGRNIKALLNDPLIDFSIAEVETELWGNDSIYDQEGDILSKKAINLYDKNKTPSPFRKVYYHGTDGKFNEFDLKNIGKHGHAFGYGYYFAENEHDAEKYGQPIATRLFISNPIIHDDAMLDKTISVEKIRTILNKIDKSGMKLRTDIKEYNPFNIYKGSKNDLDIVEAISDIGVDPNNNNKNIEKILKIITDVTGYDSVVHLPLGEDHLDATQVIVWDKSKVKLASNLAPMDTYSIAYQRAGKYDHATNTFVKPNKVVKKERVSKYAPSNQLAILNKAGVTDVKLNQIKKFDKVAKNADYLFADFTKEMAKKALEKGYVKVYSPISIQNGAPVYTSLSNLKNMLGTKEYYSKNVKLKQVAWLNINEGRYANPKLETKKLELPEVKADNKEHKLIHQASNTSKVDEGKPKLNLPTYPSSGARMPNENEVIRNYGSVKHNRVYTIKNVKDVVNALLNEAVAGMDNFKEVKFPTAKNPFISKEFKELNLTKDYNKTLDYIVDTLSQAEYTFDNGENGMLIAKMSEIVDKNVLKNRLVELLKENSSGGIRDKFNDRINKVVRNMGQYIKERAELYRQYNIAQKNNNTLKKLFEDTRQMKTWTGANVTPEVEFYKALNQTFQLTKTGRPAPSSLKNFVDKFEKYTEDDETYKNFYDPVLRTAVDLLKDAIAQDEHFGETEPTLEEMVYYNNAKQKLIQNIKDLISGKKQEKYNLAKKTTVNASVALKGLVNHYTKINTIADSAISFPFFIRNHLGKNSEFTKLFFDDYIKVSSKASLQKEEFRKYIFDDLSKEAGFKKEGALAKELKKKDYVLKDRNGKEHKISNDMIVSAYFIYNTNKEDLLRTGLTTYGRKSKTDIDFKLNDEQYQDMFNHLPKQVKDWADLVFDKYYNGKDFEYKQKVFRNIFGTEMPTTVKGSYARTYRVGQTFNGIASSSVFDNGQLATTLKGFLKERVRNKNHFKWTSASNVLEDNINSVSEWGEKSLWIEKIRTMLNTPIAEAGGHTLQKVLKDNIPEWDKWSKYMTKIVLGKEILDKTNPLIEAVTNAGQVAVLGLNIGSTLKQTLSDFSYMFDDRVGAGMWISSIPSAIRNFFRLGTIKQELMNENGYFIERFDRGDVFKALINGKLPNKISQIVLKPMEFMDSLVVRTHGYAIAERIVKAEIKNGLLKDVQIGSNLYKQAVADTLHMLVLTTQSNSDKMFMSRLRSGDTSDIARQLFGLFASDMQNKWQALKGLASEKYKSDKRAKAFKKASEDEKYTEEQREEFKKEAEKEEKTYKKSYGKKVAKIIGAMLVAGMTEVLLTNLTKKIKGKKQWGEFQSAGDFFKEAFLESTVNTIPYISAFANAIENNTDVSMFTIQRFQKLVDTFKSVQTAIEKGDENSIKKAIWNVVTNGLELTGIPATNIYQLIYGAWSQFDKSGAISAKSWAEGYSSTKMKTQYSDYIKAGDLESAKAQLGAWSSAYSVNITDDATLTELTRLSSVGYNALPSANSTTYTDDKGNEVSFTEKQATAFSKEYQRSNAPVKEIIKLQEYKQLDDKGKASVISRIYKAYQASANAKATGVAPSSKLSQLIYYCSGDINVAKYVIHLQNLKGITETKTKTRKELIVQYLNKISGLSKAEKLLIAYLGGNSVGDSGKTTLKGFLMSKGMNAKVVKAFLNIE